MVRSTVKKVMWVGRGTVFLVGLAVIVALVLGVASMALGANGQPFILGENNAATALTRLAGDVDGSAMQVVSNNAGADDTALQLIVQKGEAPMRVSSTTKVANLNADMVDGKSPGAFLPKATYTKNAESTGSDIGGGERLAVILCDAGDVVLSGGHLALDAGTTLTASAPSVDAEQGWQLRWINDGTTDTITLHILCADYPPLH
jgi:hypothetical protein